jgi:hypothetical protein
MLYLYTEQFFWWSRVKNFIKILLGRQVRGPQAVEGSLIRGLLELNVPFILNQKPKDPNGTACVISGGVKILQWAIREKQKGKFKKIIAGPIIVVTPDECNWLVASPEVDAFVVPSQWVKNWWVSFRPSLESKIKLWPAGVKDYGDLVKKDGKILIFQKNATTDLLQAVTFGLEKQGLSYEIIRYGSYGFNEYIVALSRSRFMIYLSESESQGIALFEAWMANVPTLVWDRGYLINGKYRWDDSAISAPFLTDRLGMFFKDKEDFPARLNEFIKIYDSFKPREVAIEKFTDLTATKTYLDIIKSL